MMKRVMIAICGIALLAALAVGSATAATSTMIALQGSVNPAVETDWVQQLTFNKFDPSLGTLLSVRFDLTAYLTGAMGFEHKSTTKGATVAMTLSSLVTMTNGTSAYVGVTPSYTHTQAVGVYDGAQDFGGTSGWSMSSITDSASQSAVLSPIDVGFGDFQGPGQITLDLNAFGTSGHTGSGNMIAFFETNAGADYKVTYEYATVPEPGALCALATGLVGFMGLAARRRK